MVLATWIGRLSYILFPFLFSRFRLLFCKTTTTTPTMKAVALILALAVIAGKHNVTVDLITEVH